jgi:hypothetical protein
MGHFTMNGLMVAGAALALLAVVGFAIPIFTTQQTNEVARVGGLKLQSTETASHTIPPIASGGGVVLGVVLMAASARQQR